jgi:hypothetical protein
VTPSITQVAVLMFPDWSCSSIDSEWVKYREENRMS